MKPILGKNEYLIIKTVEFNPIRDRHGNITNGNVITIDYNLVTIDHRGRQTVNNTGILNLHLNSGNMLDENFYNNTHIDGIEIKQ